MNRPDPTILGGVFRTAIFIAVFFVAATLLSGTALFGSTSVGAFTPDFGIRSFDNTPLDSLTENDFIADEIIVKLKGQQRAQRVKLESLSSRQALIAAKFNPQIEYAEPNYRAFALGTATDPYYSFQWNFNTTNGINVEPAWDVTTGEGVIVAVIDTGVAYERYSRYRQADDLEEAGFASGYDFANNDSHANDDQGHGTHVAGTIAQSTNNGEGVAGVAYGATLMPVKVLDQNGGGSYSDIVNGIYYAVDNGAAVINMSLGGPFGSNAMRDAVQYAYNNDVTVVAAAGNDGAQGILYPAAYTDYVMAVGATRYDGALSYFSNYGNGISVVAPGGDVTVDQNNDGYADGILQQTLAGNTRSFGYYFYQGTSMASPHVAGVAALVRSVGITDADIVRDIIESSARDMGALGYDSNFGWGLVDASAAVMQAQARLANDGSGDGTEPTPTPEPEPAPEPEPTPEPEPEPEPNQAPVAVIDAQTDALTDEQVIFNGSGSTDADGSIVSYVWDFGDNGAITTGATASHTFTKPGSYTVTLTVTDDDSASSSATHTISVKKPAPASRKASVSELRVVDRFRGIIYMVEGAVSYEGDEDMSGTINLDIVDSDGVAVSWAKPQSMGMRLRDGSDQSFRFVVRGPRMAVDMSAVFARLTVIDEDGESVAQEGQAFGATSSALDAQQQLQSMKDNVNMLSTDVSTRMDIDFAR